MFQPNKNLEWTLKGTVTGTAQIDLSDISFKELLIEVQYEGYSDCYTFYIVSNLLATTSHKPFNQGYCYSSDNFGICQIFVSLNSIYLGNFIHISKDSKEKALIIVFYR